MINEKMSPDLYHNMWLATDDADVRHCLDFVARLPADTIKVIMDAHNQDPAAKTAQQRLADEVCCLVYGQHELDYLMLAKEIRSGVPISTMTDHEVEYVFNTCIREAYPRRFMSINSLRTGVPIQELLTLTAVCNSKGDSRRQIAGNAVRVNGLLITDVNYKITLTDRSSESHVIIRIGKSKFSLIRFR